MADSTPRHIRMGRYTTLLVPVDGYGDYFELDILGHNTTTRHIINKTSAHFGKYGRPTEMHIDSYPRCILKEFKYFCSTWLVKHIVSAPHHHHQLNGKAERAVKIAKRMVRKAKYNNEEI